MKNIFNLYKGSNTLSTIFKLLKVKHTHKYTNRYFNEHPNKYDMFGLSRMLSHFGVNNKGIRITDKENNIYALPLPFIAHVGNGFVVVEAIKNEKVVYHWNEKKLSVPFGEFNNIWSGATLIVETDENSVEPHYKENRKRELVTEILQYLLLGAILILVIIGFAQNRIYHDIGHSLLLVLNIIGIYVGYLLILKQMNIQSSHVDKICSLFSQSDCNNVLDSPAAKFMGIFSWSELGLSYFLSNTFILLFAIQFLPYLVLLNICALPYSLWSVWYQRFKVKQWCPLCLIVQMLFWIIFITSLLSGFIQIPLFTPIDILSVGLIYGLAFLIIYLLLPQLTEARKVQRITQEYNRLKMNNAIFKNQLKAQTYYNTSKSFSDILLGDSHSEKLITIFTNPHCGPCARMHTRVETLLHETNNRLCIQYILSSFVKELDSSCEFLLFVNKNFPNNERDKIYNEWFDKGKFNKEEIFKKYNFIPNDIISEEYQKHLNWKETTKLRATPTILINGFEMPENYKIEDIAYFPDLEVDSK